MALDWRQLPTAPLHLLLVELRQVWLAMLTWGMATSDITAKEWMDNRGIIDTKSIVRHHFWKKYFLFHSGGVIGNFSAHGERTGLHLKEAHIEGFGYVWCSALWILPLAAFGLVMHALCLLLSRKIWSFETGDYLDLTWKFKRSPPFKAYVAAMCLSSIVLGIVWLWGSLMFPSHPEIEDAPYNNLSVFYDVWLNFALLVFSLNALLFPLDPVHNWELKELQKLRFRRSILHLLLGTNTNFVLKLIDGLWTARSEMDVEGRLSEKSRMQRYFWSREDAEQALVCRVDMQHLESRTHFQKYAEIESNDNESNDSEDSQSNDSQRRESE